MFRSPFTISKSKETKKHLFIKGAANNRRSNSRAEQIRNCNCKCNMTNFTRVKDRDIEFQGISFAFSVYHVFPFLSIRFAKKC